MKRLVIIAVLLGLGACQRVPNFVKPGASHQDFARAKLNCIAESNADVGGFMAIGSPLMIAAAAAGNQEQKQNVFNTCMEADGWYINGYNVPGSHP